MVRDEKVNAMDDRVTDALEQLEGQREPLRLAEQMVAAKMLGIAAALRDYGFDHYAHGLCELAEQVASTSKKTRLLLEQLSTLTDPRLDHTEPRLPPPSGT